MIITDLRYTGDAPALNSHHQGLLFQFYNRVVCFRLSVKPLPLIKAYDLLAITGYQLMKI